MLEQARSWLAHAVEASSPARDIADFKAWVATAADAARRVQVSKEIQTDADEMVRRSERVLGLAVREGQREGAIKTKGDGGWSARARRLDPLDASNEKPSTDEFFAHDTERAHVYAMTDGVSDEQFESALIDARAEGNLSRSNVVRKVKGETKPEAKRHELLRNTRHIDPTRVVRETVNTLDGLALGVGLLRDDYSGLDLDAAVAEEWATSLTNSLRVLNRLSKSIKEMTHDRS
jgi:hypothetical protein